jgi:hypothetical protein
VCNEEQAGVPVNIARNVSATLALARHAGWKDATTKVSEQVWGSRTYFALRCDLQTLPPRRPAAFPLTMTQRNPATYEGLDRELALTNGADYLEVQLRMWMREAGIEKLFVGDGPDGLPAYAQWAVGQQEQWPLHDYAPGRYPPLRADELLFEGAYTFTAYRRMGAMADGFWQLLARARDEGARSGLTYVAADNAASLRGCSAVGFELDHMSRNDRRPGFRRSVLLPPDAAAIEVWEKSAGRPHRGD